MARVSNISWPSLSPRLVDFREEQQVYLEGEIRDWLKTQRKLRENIWNEDVGFVKEKFREGIISNSVHECEQGLTEGRECQLWRHSRREVHAEEMTYSGALVEWR